MKLKSLDLNLGKNIYVVSVQDVCDSIKGYYTNDKEAIKAAKTERKEVNKPVHVDLMVWDEEEGQYIYANEKDLSADVTIEIIE